MMRQVIAVVVRVDQHRQQAVIEDLSSELEYPIWFEAIVIRHLPKGCDGMKKCYSGSYPEGKKYGGKMWMDQG